ncbi:fluoride efflux transporter CrcB [Streptomyces sp. NPDC006012]|uniref:fluoride efflux transporter CrcB n=1 Tax=Streptomyces sp. NPDC006012 TaxID=3364739 RepID=UPI0036762A84
MAEARQRRDAPRGQAQALAVIAVGGSAGASARYAASLLWPTGAADFPWTTLGVNAVGCFVIGVFLAAIIEGWSAHPLLRPFFGTGVLGGFTTFSTYCVDIERLVREGRVGLALAYLVATVVIALAAVRIGATVTRRAVQARR